MNLKITVENTIDVMDQDDFVGLLYDPLGQTNLQGIKQSQMNLFEQDVAWDQTEVELPSFPKKRGDGQSIVKYGDIQVIKNQQEMTNTKWDYKI